MLNITHILSQNNNVSVFESNGSNTVFQTWQKPRGCRYVWMMCIGAGAGGNIGTTVGGGGGGSGAVGRAFIQANLLPDTLYVLPGASSTTNGATSSISLLPVTPLVPGNIVCISGATPASLGTAESVATTTTTWLSTLGLFFSQAGVNGGTAVTALNSVITCGGGNGGNSNTTGSSILAANLSTYSTPIIAGGSTGGGRGQNGYWSWKPTFGLGGAGGGYNASGTGGTGGDAEGFGCGGGGGGGGTSGTSTGGKGGDGLVIIATL